MKNSIKTAAIIGGGPSGIQAAGELAKQNFEVTVFERSSELGGLWCYNKNDKIKKHSTITGVKPFMPERVSAMYKDLRTNVTIQSMSIEGFLPPKPNKLRFVHRSEIKDYLDSYVEHLRSQYSTKIEFRLNTNVESVQRNNGWEINSNSENRKINEHFDVLVVASGAFHKPLSTNLHEPDFRGIAFHSLYYDDPSVLKGKTVLIVGAKNSARDIFWDCMDHAKHVILASPREKDRNNVIIQNRAIHSKIQYKCSFIGRVKKIKQDGSILHENWENEIELYNKNKADVIVYCTGYKREFSFLPTELQPCNSPKEGQEKSNCFLKTIHKDYINSLFFFHPTKSRTPFNTMARETYAQARLIAHMASKRTISFHQLETLNHSLKYWLDLIFNEWQKKSLNTCSCIIHNPLFMNFLNAMVDLKDDMNGSNKIEEKVLGQVRSKMANLKYRRDNTIWHAGMELRSIADSANWNLFKFLTGKISGGPGIDSSKYFTVTWYYESGKIHSVYSEKDIKYEHLILRGEQEMKMAMA